MGIIAALLMFTCNLHLNQTACVDSYYSCVKTMSSIKIGVLSLLTTEERIASSYMYCLETGGDLDSDINYLDMVESMYHVSDRLVQPKTINKVPQLDK